MSQQPWPHKPYPPTTEMIAALPRPELPSLRRHQGPGIAVDPVSDKNSLFTPDFKRPWLGTYTVKNFKFVLRVEHFPEIIRLTQEYNKHRPSGEFPIGMSDVITAALDLAFAHPLSFTHLRKPEEVREAIGQAVYRRAFLHFIRHGML